MLLRLIMTPLAIAAALRDEIVCFFVAAGDYLEDVWKRR